MFCFALTQGLTPFYALPLRCTTATVGVFLPGAAGREGKQVVIPLPATGKVKRGVFFCRNNLCFCSTATAVLVFPLGFCTMRQHLSEAAPQQGSLAAPCTGDDVQRTPFRKETSGLVEVILFHTNSQDIESLGWAACIFRGFEPWSWY